MSTLVEVDPQTSVQAAPGDLDELHEAADCLDAYQRFRPAYCGLYEINAHLRSRIGHGEETR